MPQKNIFRMFISETFEVLKVSFAFFPFNNCSSGLRVFPKTLVVILTGTLCQQSTLLKANDKFSVSPLVPLLFK